MARKRAVRVRALPGTRRGAPAGLRAALEDAAIEQGTAGRVVGAVSGPSESAARLCRCRAPWISLRAQAETGTRRRERALGRWRGRRIDRRRLRRGRLDLPG